VRRSNVKGRLFVTALAVAAVVAGPAAAARPLPQSPCGTVSSHGSWAVYAVGVSCGDARGIVKSVASDGSHASEIAPGVHASTHDGLRCIYGSRGGKAAIQCLSTDGKKIIVAAKR